MDQHEDWKPIAGFPDYEVSSLGRVVSYRPWRGRPGPRELRGQGGSHYRAVVLASPDGVARQRYIHHLVAEAFYGPRPDGLAIRHLDGDHWNNSASNLRYGTASENQLDIVRHGRHNWAGKSHCRNGHLYTPETTRTSTDTGRRRCVTCRRSSDNARNAALRAARAAA